MSTGNRRTSMIARWTVSGVCVVFGVAYLLIGVAHDRVGYGLLEFAVMVAFAVALVVYRHRGSESAALMSGETSDERYVQLQIKSSAATGRVLILLVVAGLFWSLAADNEYVPVFTVLSFLGGATSIASSVWYGRRG